MQLVKIANRPHNHSQSSTTIHRLVLHSSSMFVSL